MAVGRPTKYKPEYDAQAAKLCRRLGATNADLAEFFDVSHATIDNWLAAHPSFLGAVKDARAEADAIVEKSLYRRAIGYEHSAVKIFMPAGATEPVYAPYTEHYPPETTAGIFWLKNRKPDQWREKQDVTVDGNLTVEIRRLGNAQG